MSAARNPAQPRVPLAFARWFDSWAGPDEPCVEGEPRVDWLRCIPFVLLHVACFSVIFVGASPIAVGLAVALYFVRMFAITAFYHRYFSHRAFRTSRAAQFCFALLANTAVQRGPPSRAPPESGHRGRSAFTFPARILVEPCRLVHGQAEFPDATAPRAGPGALQRAVLPRPLRCSGAAVRGGGGLCGG